MVQGLIGNRLTELDQGQTRLGEMLSGLRSLAEMELGGQPPPPPPQPHSAW